MRLIVKMKKSGAYNPWKGILEYDLDDDTAIAELERDYGRFIFQLEYTNVDKSNWPTFKVFANARRQMMNE
jgi:hypothetical protein|tara:strand:+ start:405 stop:617 length:213 start_codon:yes stop_codon:yes gene_type:complete